MKLETYLNAMELAKTLKEDQIWRDKKIYYKRHRQYHAFLHLCLVIGPIAIIFSVLLIIEICRGADWADKEMGYKIPGCKGSNEEAPPKGGSKQR